MAGPTDEEMDRNLIGGRTRHDDTIHLADPDPAWPAVFAAEAEQIHRVLGPVAIAVDHVGSTSVPGLAAKPFIDMVLTVADTTDEAAYVPPLETLGYVLRIREPDWYEHRFLRRADAPFQVHVFGAGCPEIDRMLQFRDRLRSDADDRALYERTKRELAARRWAHVQHYADAKADVVADILTRATSGGTGRPGPG